MLVTKEMLKKFARYEISGDELFAEEYDVEENYQVNLDDFKVLLKNLENIKNESFEKFDIEWFEYVYYEDDIAEALGLEGCNEGKWGAKEGLIKTDENLISYIMYEFEVASDELWGGEDPTIANILDLEKINKAISDYEANKTKPLTEWEFPDDLKTDFVDYVASKENHPEKISKQELTLFKRYVEELIAKDNLTALRAKGYLTYGGSGFYDCDWNTSRDCITRCFEKTGDAGFANTLGYIYYYGRCNNGVPEYEKAFQYFVYGHANQWYESSYKLADMYKGGKGTFKSEETATNIIEELYVHAYRDLCRGRGSKFADVALRMAGINENEGAKAQAYEYYLQAYYAIKKREGVHYIGDATVRKGIEEGLERTRSEIDPPENKKTVHGNFSILNEPLVDDYVCEAMVKQQKNGYKITIKRIPKRSESVPSLMFISLPHYNFCSLTDHITLYFDGEWDKEALPETFIFNDFDFDWRDDENICDIEFSLFNVAVAKMTNQFSYKMKQTRFDKGYQEEALIDDEI